MIVYKKFENKYANNVYEFILNTMQEEINVEYEVLINSIRDLQDINSNYIKSGGCFYIAVDDINNKVVGTVAIKKKNNIYEFKRFYVQKDYRNNKIGYHLYKIAEKFAKNNFISEMYLVSGKELVKAHKIYEKNGWVKIDKSIVKDSLKVRDGAYLYKKELNISNKDLENKIKILKNAYLDMSYKLHTIQK